MPEPAPPNLGKMLSEQANIEVDAAITYLKCSIYCRNHNFPKLASFFLSQCHEEIGHALKLADAGNDTGFRTYLRDTPLDLLECAQRVEEAERLNLQNLGEIKNVADNVQGAGHVAAVVAEMLVGQGKEVAVTDDLTKMVQACDSITDFAALENWIAEQE